jgi:hypothetical protein
MHLIRVKTTLVIALCLSVGCAGVSLRADGSPGPQDCPDGALEAMSIQQFRPGDYSVVVIDAHKEDQKPTLLKDGPVEGNLEYALGELPYGTRLYGRIWTSGPEVAIRYYEARSPDGDKRIPFCGEVREPQGGLVKRPDSPPGTAVIDDDYARVWVVDAFR